MNTIQLDPISIQYRKEILNIINHSRRGHIPSAFSIIEILRVLYNDILKINSQNPLWEDRDRFILSKGHGCLALYVFLSEKGFFPKDELFRFGKEDAILGGHPEYEKIPGVEASTGSLGHGLSLGVGIALNGKIDCKNYRTFILLGDGECNEGAVWEAAMSAYKHKLNRLIVIVDYNKMQSYSTTYEVQDLEPFINKWESFGFITSEVDGHNVEELKRIFNNTPLDENKPSAIICHTIKGKGIPSMENNANWHHKSNISDETIEKLFAELENKI